MLNIGNTHALDLKPLDNLPLTHFCARVHPSGKSRVALEEQNRFIEQHPDCWTTFTGAQPYGDGWRYDEDGLTPLPYYAMLRKIFKYDDDIIPNNVGWYLSEELKATIAELDQAAAAVKPAEESQTSEETVPVETVPEETAAETVEATEPAAAEE